MKLFTIGYEKRDIAEFVDILLKNRVETVIDIRAVPHSRNRDYTKNHLEKTLSENNIDYLLKKELGSEKELRDKVRSDGDYEQFFKRYDEALRDKAGLVDELSTIAKKNRACLLCYEADFNKCHRRSVAEAMAALNGKLKITHL